MIADKIESALNNDPEFLRAWNEAKSLVESDGFDVKSLKIVELLALLAEKDPEMFSNLASMVSPKQSMDHTTLFEPGKPVLVTGTGPKASQYAKETAWSKNQEAEIIFGDMFPDDPGSIAAVFNATPFNGFVVIEGLEVCLSETRTAVKAMLNDPDRTVVVVLRRPEALPELPPSDFAHWVKF